MMMMMMSQWQSTCVNQSVLEISCVWTVFSIHPVSAKPGPCSMKVDQVDQVVQVVQADQVAHRFWLHWLNTQFGCDTTAWFWSLVRLHFCLQTWCSSFKTAPSLQRKSVTLLLVSQLPTRPASESRMHFWCLFDLIKPLLEHTLDVIVCTEWQTQQHVIRWTWSRQEEKTLLSFDSLDPTPGKHTSSFWPTVPTWATVLLFQNQLDTMWHTWTLTHTFTHLHSRVDVALKSSLRVLEKNHRRLLCTTAVGFTLSKSLFNLWSPAPDKHAHRVVFIKIYFTK